MFWSVQVLVGLASASSGATNAAALRQAVPQQTVVGVFRDLRGIALATNSRRTYGELGSLHQPALQSSLQHNLTCYPLIHTCALSHVPDQA